ncbi:Eco57I restriction-modification methylase domain-containing protein [Streptomyces sp. RKAG337]|uniref:Eco57I restriction-modification methylase domain-containing protein n=1 Tax=Streptomyces sp. RKAG337 TaxID=2893404 RepID=UPI002033A621|nr:DNA methyltransferase [Streptomyces sp. RKAG337]MCM2429195.1 SAM-dependent DNA methyltransferase [Streptomyces sp. RKAG337]
MLAIAPAAYGLPRGERLTDAASRKWNYLKVVYAGFRQQLADHPQNTSADRLTRDQWLYILLDQLGYGQRLPAAPRGGIKIPEREPYRVSHEWQPHLPVHLLAWDTPLDRRTGKSRAPQSMLQDLLNVSDTRLWGLLSNGRVIRVLRDSTAITGSSYVEFDLEGIFERDLFPDFLLLFTMLHASRFELAPKPDKRRRAASTVGEDGDVGGVGGVREEDEDGDGEAAPPDLGPADCPLEWWRQHAIETGTRARDRLRDQVKRALTILGTGFLAANPELRDALARSQPALKDFHHELLRLAYQLIFLIVAEDRGVLLDPSDAAKNAREHYTKYFSTARLRRIASLRKGDRNTDLWTALVRVLDALGKDGGLRALALPELGGLYFRADNDTPGAAALLPGGPEPLRVAALPNEHLLDAVRLLSIVLDDKGRPTRIDYRHLGADELGSVYESLLELVPRRSESADSFWLQELVAGNQRKTTGSYYTPGVLIEKLLDNALDPVIDRYAASRIPGDLLKIRLVDPACGSGHVIVAAARRIALRYAVLHTGDDEPAPDAVRDAMAKVVRACVHGVDINPLAAEIAKVSLWLESLRPGEPLAYLDDRIKVGNALLGTTPVLLEQGLPDGAFTKLAGDDPEVRRRSKADNKKERPDPKQGSQHVLTEPLVLTSTAGLRTKAEELALLPGRTLAQVREHARQHRDFERDPKMRKLKRIADAWCAAFLWRKHGEAPPPITSGTLHDLEEGQDLEGGGEDELRAIVERNRFFHWHLEFPHVFRVEDRDAPDTNSVTGWQGGFDAVLGNPPWERVKIQEKEWFTTEGHEAIADADNASVRKHEIAALLTSQDDHGNPVEADREMFRRFQTALREAAGLTLMLRSSGIFPLTGFGDVNTYSVFAEKARHLLAPKGMAGLVLPTGIATDMTTSVFFSDLVEKRQLVTVLDMENEEKLFADVTNRYAFCLFTFCGPALRYERVRLAFRARRPEQLDAREFTMDADGFRRVNPNTGTSPVCQGPEHLRVLEGIHSRVDLLWRKEPGKAEANPWELRFSRMFEAATDTAERLIDSGWTLDGSVFVKGDERYLPLYEGKLANHFDSRFATYENATQAQINKGTLPRLTVESHTDPAILPLPRYWLYEPLVQAKLAAEPGKPETEWPYDWVMGWRDVCRGADMRTVIPSVLPRTAVGHKFPLMHPHGKVDALLANLTSRVLDFAARQKYAGLSLVYFVFEQLPVLAPDAYDTPVAWLGGKPSAPWIRARVLELTYTSYEMAPWAQHLGDDGPPFVWDEDRRFVMRAELDAAFLHLYGIDREELSVILDSFRAFRNKTPDLFHATSTEIIRVYEAMAKGVYTTDLAPPPAHGPRHAPGTSPLTRPPRPEPEPPTTVTAAEEPGAELPTAQDGLFGVSEIGRDEQLGIWG